MLRFDSVSKPLPKRKVYWDPVKDAELLNLNSAIKFCNRYPMHSLQDASDRLAYLKAHNYKSIHKTRWTDSDDRLIIECYKKYGRHYTLYIKHFQGRTAQAISSRAKKILKGIEDKDGI